MSKKRFKLKKRSGHKEHFSIQKITRSLERAGADSALAQRVAHQVAGVTKRGETTEHVYKRAKRYLKNTHPVIGARFTLREAIARLGPAGYDFEKFTMLLFREYGHKARLPEILQGKCISHEIDVMVEKDGVRGVVECKLRKDVGVYINIKETLAAWARFIDLRDGGRVGNCEKIDNIWMVTNSRFSTDSLIFGKCKKMKLLSWDTPREMPLPAYIDSKNLYPITILSSIQQHYLKVLSRCDILLLKDLVKYNYRDLSRNTGLNKSQLEPLITEAKEILSFTKKTG